ncbi:MAG: RCC1 domain-containing protein, partial [Roseiflexaceae bacterium]
NDHIAAALDTNGTLTTWDLGTDAVRLAEPLNNIVQFALGDSDNQRLLTLNTTGVITSYTALGNETIALGAPAVSVAAGTFHSLALTTNGDVYGWGSNANNAIITGDPTVPITTPVRTGLTDVTQIAAGLNFSMALRSDGQVLTWGDNTIGQSTVQPAARADVIQIAAGDSHALALRADGTVVAWGSNAVGQTTIPEGAVDVLYIAANAKSSAAVTRSGQIYVWGQTTVDANCCTGATTVALSTTRTLTNGVRATRQQNRSLPASISPMALQFRFSGLVHGRRYRYTVLVSNASGSRTYTGLYTSVHPFNRLFLPQIFVDSGATSSSTPSGK